MQVSVALATYNGSTHLREQLASIAWQTLPPAELVVSDDGSIDDTLEIVRAFAKTAPFPVTIVNKTARLGFADNFLHAAEACRHELVAFCDQDDVWLPNKLETCVKRIRNDGSLMALHTLTVTDSSLRPTGLNWNQGIIADKLYKPLELDPYMTGWGNSMVFRHELLQAVNRDRRPPQPERAGRPMSHDTWIYILAAALGCVSHITAPLILYRQHGKNAEGVSEPKYRSRLAKLKNVPLVRYRERAVVDGQMAVLFEELALGTTSFAEPARIAASRFRERFEVRSARARMFEDPTVASRLDAFRTFHQLASHPRPRTISRFKSLVLGVAGLNTWRPSRDV